MPKPAPPRRLDIRKRKRWIAGVLGLLALFLASMGQARAATDELPSDGGNALADLQQPLRVATREVPPFAMRDENGDWTGLAIELWQRATTKLGLSWELEELGLAEMLNATAKGEIDAAVAALTITAGRERRMDFSHPFHTTGIGIAVRRYQSLGWAAGVQRVLSGPFLQTAGGLLALLTAVGLLVWLVERRRNPQFQGDPVKGIGSGLWWSAVTMTTVGYGDKAPVTFAGRLIGLIWMFAGVILISSFTAAIATSLTVHSLGSKVDGEEDLPTVRVATLANSASELYLLAQGIRPSTTATDIDQLLKRLADGSVDALVYDAPILKYRIRQGYADRLAVLPTIVLRSDYGIALPTGSPLREPLNREILRIIQSDAWKALLTRYL